MKHVCYGSWLCKNSNARQKKRSSISPIVAQTFPSEFGFSWSKKKHFRDFSIFRVFTHGVIPGSSHTQALGISSPGIDEARVMGLAIMENCNGALCRIGRIAEADSNLHC